MATEAQLMTKLAAIYTNTSAAETIGTVPGLELTKRAASVFMTDITGKVPIGEVKYLEWFTYRLGTGDEAIYLTKVSQVELVDDILAKAT